MSDTTNLLPCPCCDGKADFVAEERGFTAYLRAQCAVCGLRGGDVEYHIRENGLTKEKNYIPPPERKAKVAEKWNRRANRPTAATPADQDAKQAGHEAGCILSHIPLELASCACGLKLAPQGVAVDAERELLTRLAWAKNAALNPEQAMAVLTEVSETALSILAAPVPAPDALSEFTQAAMDFAREHIEGDALHDNDDSTDEEVRASDDRYNATKKRLCDLYAALPNSPKAAPDARDGARFVFEHNNPEAMLKIELEVIAEFTEVRPSIDWWRNRIDAAMKSQPSAADGSDVLKWAAKQDQRIENNLRDAFTQPSAAPADGLHYVEIGSITTGDVEYTTQGAEIGGWDVDWNRKLIDSMDEFAQPETTYGVFILAAKPADDKGGA